MTDQAGPQARILKMYPPNIGKITKAFPEARKPGVIFTYGSTIYAPSGTVLPPELVIHEYVHIKQQMDCDPELWWGMYIDNLNFRLGVEIPAHKAEAEFLTRAGKDWSHVAARLASPLYGNMVTKDEAVGLLKDFAY
jgi:hypothetical protein